MADVLTKQDCLYTVLGRDTESTTATVVGSMVDVIYGPDDPDTLRSLYLLAENLQKQGRLGQATTLFERERHGRQLLSQKRAEERLGLRRRTTPAASPQDVAAARRALSGAGLGDGAGDWNA